jgi:hypothetical protein
VPSLRQWRLGALLVVMVATPFTGLEKVPPLLRSRCGVRRAGLSSQAINLAEHGIPRHTELRGDVRRAQSFIQQYP